MFDCDYVYYIPVFYVLLKGKFEDLYIHRITGCYFFMLENWSSNSLLWFWSSLNELNACQMQFKDTILIGCLFHWKQCLRRNWSMDLMKMTLVLFLLKMVHWSCWQFCLQQSSILKVLLMSIHLLMKKVTKRNRLGFGFILRSNGVLVVDVSLIYGIARILLLLK